MVDLGGVCEINLQCAKRAFQLAAERAVYFCIPENENPARACHNVPQPEDIAMTQSCAEDQ